MRALLVRAVLRGFSAIRMRMGGVIVAIRGIRCVILVRRTMLMMRKFHALPGRYRSQALQGETQGKEQDSEMAEEGSTHRRSL
jgi:hypothetical protein